MINNLNKSFIEIYYICAPTRRLHLGKGGLLEAMDIKRKQYQYLCTLADTGNFHQAADKLFITQPTLSLAIKKMEKELGTALFKRSRTTLTPTEAGEIMIAYAKKILNLEEKMEQELQQLKTTHVSQLRIGTYQILYSGIIPSLVAALRKEKPSLQIKTKHMHDQVLESALFNNLLDVILCIQNRKNPFFDTIPLKKEYVLVAIVPTHPACRKAQYRDDLPYPYLDIHALNHEPAFFQFKGQQIRWQQTKLIEEAKFEPSSIEEVDSINLAIRLASEGLGVAFTMRSYVPAMTIHKPIRYFITGNTETAPILSICTLRNRSKEPLLRTCIRIIKRILTENKGD